MTKQQARALIMQLRAHYTHDVPDETILVFSNHLEQYDYEAAQAGLSELVETEEGRWFPVWATIHKYVGRAALGGVPTVEQAYDDVAGGSVYYVPKLHPVVALTIRRMGGWERWCMRAEADPWERKRFFETYELSVAEAIRNGVGPVKLVGIMGAAETTPALGDGMLELTGGESE